MGRRGVGRKTRQRVFKRDNNTCRRCGIRYVNTKDLEVDHIKDVSEGGTNEMSNLETVCWLCHDCKNGVPYRQNHRKAKSKSERAGQKGMRLWRKKGEQREPQRPRAPAFAQRKT